MRKLGTLCLLLTTLVAGCRPTPSETPAPKSISASGGAGGGAASTSTSHVPAAIPEEPETPFELESDFRLLAMDDFAAVPAEGNSAWQMDGERLICSGKPRGYLASKEPFGNFTWRLEYRFPPTSQPVDTATFKGNTGFLVYITGEPKVWPLCLEVQGKYAEMAAIKENGGAEPPTVHGEVETRLAARKPVGQWNALEIVSREGALQVSLNGQQVTSSEPNFLSSGSIGIQAENFPFEIRRSRIRVDP